MTFFDDIKGLLTKDKRPWDKFYPKDKRKVAVPDMSLYDYIYTCNVNRMGNNAINYVNNNMSYLELFYQIDLCARAYRRQ